MEAHVTNEQQQLLRSLRRQIRTIATSLDNSRISYQIVASIKPASGWGALDKMAPDYVRRGRTLADRVDDILMGRIQPDECNELWLRILLWLREGQVWLGEVDATRQ
jgi:hypothetical protein